MIFLDALTMSPFASLLVTCLISFLAGVLVARRDRTVFVKGKGNSQRTRDVVCECGTIIRGNCSAEEMARHRHSNRHKKCLIRNAVAQVVVCEEISEYRAAALSLVSSKDSVLEIGSHVGGTTKVLASVAGHLVGLDQQSDLVAQARLRLPDIRFEVGDAFDAAQVMGIAKSIEPKKFSKVFMDISGSRDLSTVVKLIDFLDKLLRPELFVVKSQMLKRLLMRSKLWIHHPARVGHAEDHEDAEV